MSTLMPPYTDLSLDLSYLKTPFEVQIIESIFQKYFATVFLIENQQIDIQFNSTDSYLITASNMKNISPLDIFTLPSTRATLLISGTLFYLLISLGNSHVIGSSIAGFLKKDIETFSKIGGGRFANTFSKNILSLEEDEFGRYYILLSNRADLLSIDELFNFSRQILNSSI